MAKKPTTTESKEALPPNDEGFLQPPLYGLGVAGSMAVKVIEEIKTEDGGGTGKAKQRFLTLSFG